MLGSAETVEAADAAEGGQLFEPVDAAHHQQLRLPAAGRGRRHGQRAGRRRRRQGDRPGRDDHRHRRARAQRGSAARERAAPARTGGGIRPDGLGNRAGRHGHDRLAELAHLQRAHAGHMAGHGHGLAGRRPSGRPRLRRPAVERGGGGPAPGQRLLPGAPRGRRMAPDQGAGGAAGRRRRAHPQMGRHQRGSGRGSGRDRPPA